ncbi:MAG: TRAP transporter substrate-binding protein DctP [Candidatus Merdivicinus sp.]|uniref:TRAP transporter substrate-binding protein DctP n=1 Tax=Anaerotruncus rubiinfantis TaxID=1720200 RepID=UPI0018980BD5|nr:TRAP transporter substrate-binding protein DctP [Anaerotruncus rubiinfantis]
MKKVIALVLSMSLLLLAACDKSASGAESQTAPAQPSGQASAPADTSKDSSESYSFRLATHYATSHPGYAALERIAADLNEQSGGKIEVKLYPSSQLGDYTLTYEDLMRGSVDFALIPIPSEYDPKLEMNFVPYMVTDYSQMESAYGPDSYFYKEYGGIHENLGVKLLGLYVEGLIGFGLTQLPDSYADPAAFKGLMIRCPAIEVYNLVTEDMGYSATTIPYADLYSALQTGVVDGWIGGTPQLNYTDFKDVIKYYVDYNVFAENIGFFMSLDVFNSLPAEYQTMIQDAFMKEAINSYAVAEQLDNEALSKMEEYGIEIVRLTDEQRAAYAKSIQEKTWPRLYKNIGEETLKKLVEAVQ